MDMWNLQYGLLKTNKLLFKETQLLYKLKFKSYQIALLKLLGVLIAYILAYLYTMVSMYFTWNQNISMYSLLPLSKCRAFLWKLL